MIDRKTLLSDLQSVLRQLEADLIQRSTSPDVPEVGAWLQTEFAKASEAKRTAQNYTDWLNDYATQVAAAWVLSCVFARFLEDNGLYETPMIAGPTGHGNNGNNKSHDSHTSHKSHHQPPAANHLQRAKDERELYFGQHPGLTDRDYLLHVFQTLRDLKGGIVKEVFGGHNPVNELPNWLGPDAAGILLRFFQQIDPNTGDIRHDFTQSSRHSPSAAASAQADGTRSVPATFDTRFLGDLYQDLSEAARKKYALLQTPEFVEEFILDRTLDPALDEFGLRPVISGQSAVASKSTSLTDDCQLPTANFKMIDPACGSGHFLLGTFPRILNRWQRQEPSTNVRELVQRTLDSIHGVDINPFAIAIARFRLLLAAMRACGVTRLIDAPAFRLNLVCGDSLLHAPLAAGGKKYTAGQQELDFALASDPADSDECDHAYRSENLSELKRLLRGGQYHAVVANPPYIVPRDKLLNERYRRRFRSCHMTYSLSVPFFERIFRLATTQGYTGQITANSFMKREFGKKLIEDFMPTVDLTHVIDTSGAYIPGHGTPTLILFGRNQEPVTSTIRTVMGKRGEPRSPQNAAKGLVWNAINNQIDQAGSHGEFVSVVDSERTLFERHPWTLAGGGIADLKVLLDNSSDQKLGTFIKHAGRTNSPGIDDCYLTDTESARRFRILDWCLPIAVGDCVRDWQLLDLPRVVYPYVRIGGDPIAADAYVVSKYLWFSRTLLRTRTVYGKSLQENGRSWFEHLEHYVEKLRTRISLCWVEISTHNHFVFDNGFTLFKQTAPVLKLRDEFVEQDYLSFAGILNSSTVCLWLKQVCHNKGDATDQQGARTTGDPAFDTYDFKSTKLEQLPVPTQRPLDLAAKLHQLATQKAQRSPANTLRTVLFANRSDGCVNIQQSLCIAANTSNALQGSMIHLQEELDWQCYQLFGLIEEDVTSHRDPFDICLGERAFEIVLARKMAAGETQTTWFERHGSTPITELPAEWPDDYRQLVQRRIDLIASDPNIRLIEQPEYKRRWNTEPWDTQLARALREWLLDRLESYFDFDGRMANRGQGAGVGDQGESQEGVSENRKLKTENPPALASIQLYSIAKLADVASKDADFMQVAELYRDNPAFNVLALVEELVAAETVPLLPVLRYKDTGLRKRAEWEKTWDLQREEDRLEAERQTANERIQKAAAAVRERFADQKHELDALEQKVRDCCLSVRDKYAPKLDFGSHQSPSVMYRLLGTGTAVDYEGGAAMAVLKDWTEEFENKSSSFETLVTEARKNDPEYQAALAAHAAIPPNPKIAVPPKYTSVDFISTGGARYWALHGKLDVPKERWISFPGAEAEDGSLMICWAGYDQLQQAQAISAWYVEIRDQQGGHNDKRLIPLLACLLELLPWIKQWHNSSDNEFNMSMADFFEGFLQEESRQLPRPVSEAAEPDSEALSPDAAAVTFGWSLPEIKAWKPSARRPAKRAAKKASAPKKAAKKRGKKTEKDE